MLNIVVPMAGRGSRFSEAGYLLPKPLIPVKGIPMISLVIENLRPTIPHRFVFLCLREHLEQHGLGDLLLAAAPGSLIIPVDDVTEGPACTVLLAEQYINTPDPLMIANCDQWIDFSMDAYLAVMDQQQADGLIMTMRADDPKWSFVRFDSSGSICEVVEKQVVSNEATVGIYNYRQGRFFVDAARKMIARDFRVNGEFYVAPAYNEMITAGMKLAVCNIGSEAAGMYGLGIPADLQLFEQLSLVAERS